jgi:hypothetical protein
LDLRRGKIPGERGKALLNFRAKYNALFEAEKEDIGPENTYLRNVEPRESTVCLDPTPGHRAPSARKVQAFTSVGKTIEAKMEKGVRQRLLAAALKQKT